MDLKFGLDVTNKTLLAPDGQSLTIPPLFQGDDISISLQGMERLQNGDYLKVPIDFSRIKIGIGLVDAPPMAGTFCLQVEGEKTEVLPHNASKESIAEKLNALPSVTQRGGIRVLPQGAANIYLLAWKVPTVTTPIEVVDKKLFPHCFARVYQWPQADGMVFIVKLFQAPLAFTDAFSLPVAPPVNVVRVRSGTGTRNEIQRVNVPRDAQGEFSFTWNGLTTAIVPVAEAGASSIAAVLNDLYSDNVTRFRVTQPGTGYYYVEFVGPLAFSPQELLVPSMESQQQLQTPTGSLNLRGAGLEFALAGKASLTMRLEIEITTASGAVGTPIQREVTILNDMLDSDMSLVPDQQWLDEKRSEVAVVEYDWEAPPTFLGTIGYAHNAGDAVRSDWTFVHNMGTRDVHITLRDNVTGLRVPDNEYEAIVLDENNVRINFPQPPEANRYAVLITAANVGEHFRAHRHAIADINGLQDILNSLTALGNPLDLWPSIPVEKLPEIPASKLTGKLEDDQLPSDLARLDEQGFLKVTNLPLSVPRIDAEGSLVVSTDGKTWLQILTPERTLAPAIFGDLSKSTAFVNSIKSVLAGLNVTGTNSGLVIPLQTISEIIGYRGSVPSGPSGIEMRALPNLAPQLTPAQSYERELWRIAVNPNMLAVSRALAVDWGVSLQMLRANCHAQYSLVVELGSYPTESLINVNWNIEAPIIRLPIAMTSEIVVHSFGVKIKRLESGLTLEQQLYGIWSRNDAAAPSTANFALRCRLISLDPEDVPEPRGWISYGVVPSTTAENGVTSPQARIQ